MTSSANSKFAVATFEYLKEKYCYVFFLTDQDDEYVIMDAFVGDDESDEETTGLVYSTTQRGTVQVSGIFNC